MSYEPTQQDFAGMRATWDDWHAARARRDFAVADQLRAKLLDAGVDLDTGAWHPVYESPQHRSARLGAMQ